MYPPSSTCGGYDELGLYDNGETDTRSGQTKEYKIAIGLLLLPGTEPDSLIECN
jgi:hypothetical protein